MGEDKLFTMNELEAAVQKLKLGEASGLDDICGMCEGFDETVPRDGFGSDEWMP